LRLPWSITPRARPSQTAQAGAVGAAPRALAEDSDVIVALIRAAYIIAFIAFFTNRYVTRSSVPLHMDIVLFVASVFTLLSFVLYLNGRSLQQQRPLALLLDLFLVTATIATMRMTTNSSMIGQRQDMFGLYYLVIIAAAVWYRLAGSVTVAAVAIVLTGFSLQLFPDAYWGTAREFLLTSAHPPLLVLISVIAGYLMRARDAEHLAVVELRQEMRLARTLQSKMLPDRLPSLPEYDLGLVFSPARQVGGDFYDLRLLDHDHLLIVLADMSGKSVYGLVHLSLVYSHLQSAAKAGHSPSRIATLVNRGTYDALQPESYAAVFIGVLRLSDGLLTFVNCGHVPPVRVRRQGSLEPDLLTTGGTVIGAIRDAQYEERAVTLARGDALVCFSDGVTDSRDNRRECFGEERVAELARQTLDLSAPEIAEGVAKAADKHAARPGQDDVTILVICRGKSSKS
jgi:serine phosphatase RsbU (regulator of sigma subunit)